MEGRTQFITDGNRLIFGDITWHEYNFCFTIADVFGLMGIYRCGLYKTGFRNTYKEFNDRYGITPSKWKSVFNGKMTNLWRIPDWALYAMFTRKGMQKRPKIDVYTVRSYFEHKTLCDQLHEDKLDHLLPFVLHYGENPKQLRERFGKSVWKQLCHNSRTRNLCIMTSSKQYRQNEDYSIKRLTMLPSTLIPYVYIVDSSLLMCMYSTVNSCKHVVEMCHNGKYRLFMDTLNMAHQLNKTLNVNNMTLKQWEKKHTEFSIELTKRDHSPEPINCVKPHTYVEGPYSATALVSPYEIAMEGSKMHHCVASYIDLVINGLYLVYTLRKNEIHYGTIGLEIGRRLWVGPNDNTIKIGDRSSIRIQQIYGHCNSLIDLEGFNQEEFTTSIFNLYWGTE